MPSAASPFAAERFEFRSDQAQGCRDLVDLALAILGASTAQDTSAPVGQILPIGMNVDRDALPSDHGTPVFIFPSSNARASVEAAAGTFRELTGLALELTAAADCRNYEFAASPELWPFSRLALQEDRARSLWASRPAEGVETLLRSESGGVFLCSRAGRRTVYLSLVPLPNANEGRLFKEHFRAGRFVGLLPLLVFARVALGEAGWRSRRLSASFLVDDPNLRFRRYGFLSLEAVVEAASSEDLHLSIAMIPLDYRKTRRRAATLIRNNPQTLSVVYHGVDHRKSEFESEIDPTGAEAALGQAIARMEDHRRRTGVAHASVMTFPHGDCSPTWLRAMRNVGFDAALASRALPFAHDTGLRNPLYELLPAELGFAGFPVVNRFKCENPPEELLFHAWLGKPLIIYTHHEYFRDGLEEVVSIARLLNRTVRPVWRDIGSLMEDNYQQRTRAGGAEVRVFSNHVSIPNDLGAVHVLKPAAVPLDEMCLVGGVPTTFANLADGPALLNLEPSRGAVHVSFRPPLSPRPVAVRRISALSRARRAATELRDQGAPIASRLRSAVS